MKNTFGILLLSATLFSAHALTAQSQDGPPEYREGHSLPTFAPSARSPFRASFTEQSEGFLPNSSLAGRSETKPASHPFRIRIYTGGPSIFKAAFKFSSRFQDEVTFSGKPLIGIAADYKLVKWFSVGIDCAYRYGQLDFEINDSTLFEEIDRKWNVDVSQYVDPFGHYTLKFPRFRGMLKANIHFMPNSPRSDLYVSFGIGYNRVKPRLFLDGEEIRFFNKIGKLSLPVAYRISFGYTWHFLENVGCFAEIGIGGPVFSTGLSLRF